MGLSPWAFHCRRAPIITNLERMNRPLIAIEPAAQLATCSHPPESHVVAKPASGESPASEIHRSTGSKKLRAYQQAPGFPLLPPATKTQRAARARRNKLPIPVQSDLKLVCPRLSPVALAIPFACCYLLFLLCYNATGGAHLCFLKTSFPATDKVTALHGTCIRSANLIRTGRITNCTHLFKIFVSELN